MNATSVEVTGRFVASWTDGNGDRGEKKFKTLAGAQNYVQWLHECGRDNKPCLELRPAHEPDPIGNAQLRNRIARNAAIHDARRLRDVAQPDLFAVRAAIELARSFNRAIVRREQKQ